MPQKLYPSAHIIEMFMPYLHDEKRLIEVLKRIAEMDFYRNVELPTFPTKEHRDTVRRILRDNDLTAATYAAPYLNERKMSLCDLHMDPAEAPDWKTEGFLTPEVGAEIIRRAAAFDKPEGVRRFWVSVEVLGHRGDSLWHKERIAREFLTRCWEESGVEMSR